jgi:hypothetical protein
MPRLPIAYKSFVEALMQGMPLGTDICVFPIPMKMSLFYDSIQIFPYPLALLTGCLK